MYLRLIYLFLFSLSLLSFIDAQKSDTPREARFIIELEIDKSASFKSKLATELSLKQSKIYTKCIFPSLSIYSLVINGSHKLQVETALREINSVISFHEDEKTNLRATIPNDTDYSEQWNLDLIGAPKAWDQTKGGKTKAGHDIVVAIIDNGYDVTHEDLQENIWINTAEIPDNGIDDDSNGYIDDYRGVNTREENGEIPSRTHGTAVAGIIGARGNNSQGISGINWEVKMMMITGQAFVSDIIESYNYALIQRKLFNETEGKEGALVVATNFSSGIDEAFAEDYPVWCNVYDELGAHGILNIAAAPNNGKDIDAVGDMPATCPSEFLVIVNNIDRNESLVSDSGFGKTHIDIAAPGDEAFSLSIQNSYKEFSGTSSATPHVAGAIALIYSVDKKNLSTQLLSDPQRTATTIRNIIYDSATQNEGLVDRNQTGGRLNLADAIAEAERLYDIDSELSMSVYPNPTNSALTVNYLVAEIEKHEVEIFNTRGRLIYSSQFIPNNIDPYQLQINLNTSYTQGIYFLSISNSKQTTTRSFMVY